MHFLFIYLHSRRRSILYFVLCCVVFYVVLFLARLPVAPVLYAAALCFVFGFLFLLVDFCSLAAKHRRLAVLTQSILSGNDDFPPPADQTEMDYQAQLRSLLLEKQNTSEQMMRENRELVEYYTIWVHQIKTPIAAMRLILQEENTKVNRELSEELQRIEQYVEMAIGYLRLGSESTDFVIREYDLDTILRKTVKKYASQFIRKKIRMDFRETNFRVLTDEKWLSFVIEQVLSNALKYTKRGTITLSMPQAGVLVIADTGIGIAPEDLPRVFEKGYTGFNGREDHRATGIGLYLCRRILTKLGHTITAQSRISQGTSIIIDLNHAALEVE